MADDFTERYGDLLQGSYDCVDRIVLNAFYSLGHSAGGFREWWRRLNNGSEEDLDNAHLMRMAGRFGRRVHGFARVHGIPIIDCRRRERKHRIAEEYPASHPVKRGLFLILVGRAMASVWDVQHSARGVVKNLEKSGRTSITTRSPSSTRNGATSPSRWPATHRSARRSSCRFLMPRRSRVRGQRLQVNCLVDSTMAARTTALERMLESNWARGYHGTSLAAAEAVLNGGFKISRNDYDWLGDGVYFFQDAPARALEWASALHGPTAVVLCARIILEDCMDLLDIGWGRVLTDSYDGFLAQLKRSGLAIPRQSTGAHRLDREVINYALGVLAEKGITIRSVRAAFSEGAPVFANSALMDRAHVQIAVRDIAIIHEVHILRS